LPLFDADTSRGKRTSQLDLNLPSDRSTLATLIKDADVFLQAYRPGSLGAKGFRVQDVVNTKPGIVYANLKAYGWEGPWKDRRGVRISHTLPFFPPPTLIFFTLVT
jgi:crotonobetainyl-CoA:carnitine CoA-transferase CaiB-like acyl-CoA transferase